MTKQEGGYTFSEIEDQPQAWQSTIEVVDEEKEFLKQFFHNMDDEEIIFTGCGTSYYLSLSAAALFQSFTNRRARGVPSSELVLFPQSVITKGKDYLLISFSRSGETSETILAVQRLKEEFGARCLAFTCDANSPLAKICDHTIAIERAGEKSVVMTKSFTSMLLAAQMCIAIILGDEKYYRQLASLPQIGKRILSEKKNYVKEIGENDELTHFVFLGTGPYYGLACESMLKMKEMTYTTSEAYYSLEFRHGPISCVSKNTLVVCLHSNSGDSYEKDILKDVRNFGARTLLMVEKLTERRAGNADYVIELSSKLSPWVGGMLYMPFTQLLGYYRARHRGIDPDHPQHLTPVVRLREI